MSSAKALPIQRDWLAKTVAGTVLGFTLALACSGVFTRLSPDIPLTARAQLAMWMVVPIWLGTLAATYVLRSGRHAWLWLTGANLLAFALLALLSRS